MDIERKLDFASIIVKLIGTIVAEKELCPDRPVLAVSDRSSHLPEHSIATDPAGYSLRLGLQHLGKILDAEGGLGLMREIYGAIEILPRYASTSLPVTILNEAWDGIGDWCA